MRLIEATRGFLQRAIEVLMFIGILLVITTTQQGCATVVCGTGGALGGAAKGLSKGIPADLRAMRDGLGGMTSGDMQQEAMNGSGVWEGQGSILEQLQKEGY